MKKYYLSLIFTCLLFHISGNAQILPCSGGYAGTFPNGYPCNDYDLMSRVPISTLATTAGTEEGSDAWGWTDPLNGKEYAIVGTTNSTAFVDISDPVNPIFLGRINTETSTSYWRDVKVYNNHAFIVADAVGAHGMQVFDLTRLRLGVDADLTYTPDTVYTGVNSCHNIVINESEGYAYLVGCNTYSGGVTFIDISNPTNPVDVGGHSADGYTHDAQVVTYNGPDTDYTGQEILIASNANKVVILDVTNKSSVVKISEISYSQIGYTHQGWFTDDQRYFILGDETDEQNYGINTRTLVFDFLDLDNPTLSSTYSGPTTAIDHNGYVLGDKFYLANYRAGLRVLDITNISAASNSMTEIGYFDTYPTSNGTAFNGAWSVYPYFASGNIIISDIERGLFVVRQSNTLSIEDTQLKDSFSITPNPTVNNPIIKSKQSQSINTIEVYNVLGKRVFSKDNINLQEFVLPIQNYSAGIYLIRINNTITKKLVLN